MRIGSPLLDLDKLNSALLMHTHKDLLSRRMRMITVSQLNFTATDSREIIATINASAEGITISADNIEISGSTIFSSGYDPTDKVDESGGSYESAPSGARVLIFPNANTGIQVIDDGAADVFRVMVGGDSIGDVILGDYAGGKGLFYDKSANTLTFKGDFTAGTMSASLITSGSLSVTYTDAKCTDASADQTSANTAAYIASQGALATRNSVGTGQIDTTVISGGKIVTGLLTAANIQTGTMNAARINAGDINGVTVTGVTITGGILRTASSGTRVYITDNDATGHIRFYNGAVETGRMKTGTSIFQLECPVSGGDLRYLADEHRFYNRLGGSGRIICPTLSCATVTASGANQGLTLKATASTDTAISTSGGIQLGTDKRIKSSSGYIMLDPASSNAYCEAHFKPNGDKTYNLGATSSGRWDNVYADDFVNQCWWLDNKDDVALIRNMKPLKDKNGKLVLEMGLPKIDHSTLPDFVRVGYKYRYRTPEQLKKKFGSKEIPKLQNSYSIGKMVDLLLGAVRQLDKENGIMKQEIKVLTNN